MLRAGPFSDDRVIALINRRFVALYYDIWDGVAFDADALRFVGRVRPELLRGAVATPPVLIMTDAGEVVAEIDSYADPTPFLEGLQRALSAQPDYAAESEAERTASPLERVALAVDLGQLEHAEAAAAARQADPNCTPAEREALAYRRGHVARRQRRWTAMAEHFARLTDPGLRDQARVEAAYRLWYERRYDGLAAALAEVPDTSERATEAQYLAGLASFHQGRRDEALAQWKALIAARRDRLDRWVYRADWAYTDVIQGERSAFSTAGPRVSLLDRLGYMGKHNPDLSGPAD